MWVSELTVAAALAPAKFCASASADPCVTFKFDNGLRTIRYVSGESRANTLIAIAVARKI